MSLYKNLQPFLEYLFFIRRLDTHLSFDLKFPDKWGIPKNTNDKIQIIPFEVEERETKGVTIVCLAQENDIELTINIINKIIKINKEREIKEQLFKQTINELKKTFEQNDLDKLQTLYFDFEDKNEEIKLSDTDDETSTDIELVGE